MLVGLAVALVGPRNGETAIVEIAAATMTDEGLPVATTATANARFICEDDECFVEVDLTALPDAGSANLELWVINGDVSNMFSLGTISQDTGRFPIPYGVTANEYPIVDISIEPEDGDATHSGQSVLRGVLG